MLTPFRIDKLCLGGLLAILLRRDGGADFLVRHAAKGVLIFAGVAFLVSVWCAKTGDFLPALHQVRVTIYAFMFGALTLLGLSNPSGSPAIARALNAKWLRTFGKYAYGLCIYHGLLTYLLIEQNAESRLTEQLGNHTSARVVLAVGATAVSLAARRSVTDSLRNPSSASNAIS